VVDGSSHIEAPPAKTGRAMNYRPRRILFISPQPYFQWRGSPIRVGFNMLALSQLGFEVDLLTLPFGEDRDTPGVRIIRVKNTFGLKNIPIGPSIWKVLFAFRLYAEARRLIRERPYDVIHAVEDGGMIAVSLARMSKAKFVFEKHSDPSSYKKGAIRNFIMWLYGKVEARSIRHADAVIGTGPGLVEQARRWIRTGKTAHHIFDIPSSLAGANPEKVKSIRASWCPHGDEVVVLYVGSFAVYQGIELIFDAIPEICRHDEHVRFVIIGGSAEEIEARSESLREQRCEDNVVFAGKIPPDELPNYLAAADILLSPRISGTNTPLKLLDYLKAGRCILATDNEANRQILDEASAYFVQTDVGSFAAGISALANDMALREKLASKGTALISDVYSYEQFKRRLGLVYNELFR
jgi:glycosyltransferase involved in cell wall biosynthesis